MVSVQNVNVLVDGKPMPVIQSSLLGAEHELPRKDRSLIEKIAIITASCGPKDARYHEKTDVRNISQSYFHTTTLSRSCRGDSNVYPLSPCSGVSEECKAMANACSHDHDYSEQPPDLLYSPRSPDQSKQKMNSTSRIIAQSVDTIATTVNTMPRTSNKMRPRRIMLVRKAAMDLNNVQGLETCDGHFVKPVPPERRISDGFSKESAILNDNVVCQLKLTGRESFHDNSSSDDTNTNVDEIGIHLVPPRPSITPFPPPKGHRIHRRGNFSPTKKQALFPTDATTNIDDLTEPSMCTTSVDSAYNSLSCSLSHPGIRPPSGGKRSATCGLTLSSSSGASSDEASDFEILHCFTMNEHKKSLSENLKTEENFVPHKPFISSSWHQRKTVSAKKHKKVSTGSDDNRRSNPENDEVLHFVPTPPLRKGKSRSIPMRLRALPSSFWEEPNCTSQSPHTILPPVYPFLHQGLNEDIAEILPETPSQEKESSAPVQITSTAGYDRPRQGTVIKTGDTDLLLRLFDQVEAMPDRTVSRPKCGRPKRHSRNLVPAYRQGRDENPCIIHSITEKLFPKLSLDSRYGITSSTMSLGTTIPGFSTNAEVVSETKQSKYTNLTADNDPSESQSPPSSSLDSTDSCGESMSLLPAQSRQPLLPQLVTPKEYPQLLNELAAVL